MNRLILKSTENRLFTSFPHLNCLRFLFLVLSLFFIFYIQIQKKTKAFKLHQLVSQLYKMFHHQDSLSVILLIKKNYHQNLSSSLMLQIFPSFLIFSSLPCLDLFQFHLEMDQMKSYPSLSILQASFKEEPSLLHWMFLSFQQRVQEEPLQVVILQNLNFRKLKFIFHFNFAPHP